MGHSFKQSKLIRGIKYDTATRVLTVFLRDGRPIRYQFVDPKTFSEFLNVVDKDDFYTEFKQNHDRLGAPKNKKKSLDSFIQ